MKKPWIVINKSHIEDISQCIQELKKKKIILSPWILDIVKNKKNKIKITKKKVILFRLDLKYLGFTKPTTLKEVYKKIKKMNYELVQVEPIKDTTTYFVFMKRQKN